MKRAHAGWVVLAGLVGCDDPPPLADAAEGGVDASMDARVQAPDVGSMDVGVPRDVPRDAGVDLAPSIDVACDPAAHVDCFFAVDCSGGVVRAAPNQPYYCCDERQCLAAYQRGICWTRHETCSAGCGDMRRFGCDREARIRRYQPTVGGGDLHDFCAEGGRTSGDRCAVDRDCTPSQPGLPGRLRCDRDGGVCVTAPRPSVPAGSACLIDDDCADGMLCACDSATAGRCIARP